MSSAPVFFSVRSRHQHGPALDGERFGPQMIWLLASPSCAPLYGALESRLWKLLVHSISLQLQIFLRVIPPWLLILSCVIFPISNLGLSFLQLLPPQSKSAFGLLIDFFSYFHIFIFIILNPILLRNCVLFLKLNNVISYYFFHIKNTCSYAFPSTIQDPILFFF